MAFEMQKPNPQAASSDDEFAPDDEARQAKSSAGGSELSSSVLAMLDKFVEAPLWR